MKKLLALGIAFMSVGWCAAPNKYEQHNLVSDLAGMADRIDPCLINPGGIVATPTSPFWISDNGTGLSTLYNGNGVPSALVVGVPGPAGTTTPAQQCGGRGFGPGAPP